MQHKIAVLYTHGIILLWPLPCLTLTLHKYSLAYNVENSNASKWLKHRIWNTSYKKIDSFMLNWLVSKEVVTCTSQWLLKRSYCTRSIIELHSLLFHTRVFVHLETASLGSFLCYSNPDTISAYFSIKLILSIYTQVFTEASLSKFCMHFLLLQYVLQALPIYSFLLNCAISIKRKQLWWNS
jgi:hypothetical protein